MEIKIQSRKYGTVTVIVDDDRTDLLVYKWHLSSSRTGLLYVHAQIAGKKQRLHTVILTPKAGFVIDHINGNRFDNRSSNLRYATLSQNGQNKISSKRRAEIKSEYKGVSWHKTGKGGWRARIRVDGKYKCLGVFQSEEDAARAYDAAAMQFHGEFARPNFPEVSHR